MNSATQAAGLENKVVIVTGGGRGLGRAISAGFAQAGARVALVGRDAATLAQARHTIVEAGGQAEAFLADVSDESSVEALCKEVVATWGCIDVLVNNAGINPWYKPAEDTALTEWRAIIDTNLTGVFLTCKHAGRHMLAAGRGAIINITSVAGRVGLSKTTAYCAAKGGVELMTRQLAMDWAQRGVRVNAVAPGYFATELTEGMRQHPVLGKRVTDRTPMGRFGEPDEIVGACLFLASPAAGYITGQSLGVDGGWTAC
ncbi:SDR family oxidoreductase [Pseudomonas sp. PCH199]|uniref:SDR family NAD(P)-dependent oxidoreductase n=1 Tax=unclassified Pseudomonas TaxID=196821 RepID=UPI000BCB8018|nr:MULTISPECIES: SDR family NAD(P)-dependent oxidoreductase [unclassified Pseudomonas]MCW8279094.1 SDR family oxidoreductase [Pseudomonas sp. PCH199]PAM79607.1 short-chain dehydrogenase [Pseudomonas sp. ERMR1:02]